MGAKRVIYIGTTDGVYRAEGNGSSYESRLLGLEGKGAIRGPVVIDCDDPRRLYVGTTRGGVYRSDDAGATWRACNDNLLSFSVWSLVQHPKTGTLWLGTEPSAVYRSDDRGETWTPCPHLQTLPTTIDWTFPQPPHVSHVKHLAVHPTDPDVVMGAVEEGWLIRTTDGGQSWENLKDGCHFDSHSVAFMPDNPTVVTSTAGHGFFRSEDGGDHFAECVNGLDHQYLAQVVVHAERPRVLLTAGAAGPPPTWRGPRGGDAGFYRSENQGATWERLTGGLPELLKGAPRSTAGDRADVESFLVGLSDGSVWLSENSGGSFRQILGGIPGVGSMTVAPA